jgi:GNAT superfamily N-acetyltransferase
MVLAKDLNQIVTSERRSRLRLEEIEPRHLPLLYDLNRRRCFTRANRRFAEDVARGYRGFVAFMDEELMGYYWWVDSSDPLHRDLVRLGLGIELDDGDVYGSDFFILDEYRGGGAANDFLDELETTLKERGYGRLWGYVESTNRPARWIYSARGYEAVRTVTKRR